MSDKNRRIHCFVDVEIGGNSAGRIVLELFSDVCPKTCSNFVKLCNGEKIDDELVCYKGRPFSAVDSAVKVECTCSSEAASEELRSRTYSDEISVLKHFKELLLSTANRGSEANGLQWIITTASTPELNSTHLVFGRVVSGQGVVEQIHAATKDDHGQKTARARIGNCGELKPRSSDQRKRPPRYRSSADFYNSRDSSDELQEDSWTKSLTLASLFKRNNKLSRVGSSTPGDRKIKGRGTVRYKGSSSRSHSESDDTPPHWRTELEKVKPLGKDAQELPDDRWIKGDKLFLCEQLLSRRSDRIHSRTESDDDYTGRCRQRSGRYSRKYEDDSDQESSSQRSRKKLPERYSRRYESDEENSRSYRKMSKNYYSRQGESESEDDRKSKKRSRNRSRSSSDNRSGRYSRRYQEDSDQESSSKRSRKKSQRYSRRSDKDEDDSRSYCKVSEKYYSRRGESQSDDDLKSKKRSRNRSRSVVYGSSVDSPRRSKKKSRRAYSSRDDFATDEEVLRSLKKVRQSRSSEYVTDDDSSTRSSKKLERHHWRRGLLKSNDDSPRRSDRTSRRFSKRAEYKVKEDSSDQYEHRSERYDSGTKGSENDRDDKQRSSCYEDSAKSPFEKKELSKRNTESKKEKHKLSMHSPNSRDFSREPFSEAESEHSRTSTLDSCYLKRDKSERLCLKASESKSIGKHESCHLKRNARKDGLESENTKDFVNKIRDKNSSLDRVEEAVKRSIKKRMFSEDAASDYSYKTEVKSSDEELKTGRKSRKEGRQYKAESSVPGKLKLQTVGDRTKPKLEEPSDQLNSRTFTEEYATNRVESKKRISRADRVEIVVPLSEEEEDNKVIQPSHKKKLKLSSPEFNWGDAYAASSTGKKGNMSASKKGIREIEKRSRTDINKSGGSMEEFLLDSRSRETSGSNSGSSVRLQSTNGSGETAGSRSSFDSRRAEMMEGGKKSKDFLEIPKSGFSPTGNTRRGSRTLSTDDEENQPPLSTMENKKIHGDKFSPKTHSVCANYSLELSMKYSRIKKLQLKNKLKQLEPHSYALSSLLQTVSSPSRSDNHDLTDQPEFVSRKQSKSQSEKIPSSGRHLSSSPEWPVHQRNSRSKSRSCSKPSSRSPVSSTRTGKHGRWSQSPKSQRKRKRSSDSSQSYLSRSRNYESQRSGRRHGMRSSSSGNSSSRSRSSSRSWSRSQSSTESRSRGRQQSLYSSHMAKPALSVTSVALPLGDSSSAAVENLSESPPPSRWKPGQKPWKPKNILPAINSLAGNVPSALSAQRSKEGYFQKSQLQRSNEVGRNSPMDGQCKRSHESNKGLKVRGHGRHSYISEDSSRNSSSDRSVSKNRSYSRPDSSRSMSRSDQSKSRSDRSNSKSDRSKSRSDRSLYKSKAKNTKANVKSYYSRSRTDSRSGDSMNRTGSQKSHTGHSMSRSTSSRSGRSRSTSSRSSLSGSGNSRSNSRSNRSKRNEEERHQILKKSSALNAQSCQEQSKASHNISVSSKRDAYDKPAATALDTVKSVKKENVEKKKKVSPKVQWEPPVEPEYILGDTEDEDAKPDNPNQLSIRKNRKQGKKDGDATGAENDKTEISSEPNAQKERTSEKDLISENDAMEQTLAEVHEEGNGHPKDEGLVEPCKATAAGDTRLDLSDALEKQDLNTEMDIITEVILEAKDRILDTEAESKFDLVSTENQIADVKAEKQVADVKAENEVGDVKAENEVGDVKAENEVGDVNAKNTVIEVTAGNQTVNNTVQNKTASVIGEIQVTHVKAENQMMLDVNAENQMMLDVKAENQMMDVKAENQLMLDVKAENQMMLDVKAENQMMLDVKAENQKISDVNIKGQTGESLLPQSESKDRRSHDRRNIANVMGEAATSRSNILETRNKASDAVNAEELTRQNAPESCYSAVVSTGAEFKGVSESDSKVELVLSSGVELAPKSQMTFRQHQSRSGPSKLPNLNLQDNRLLGKQLNFMWKSRLRLPVPGSAGVVRLNSPESPRAPVLSSTISPDKSNHNRNVVEKSPALVHNSPAELDKEQQAISKLSTKESSEKVRRSGLVPGESLRIPSAKRSVFSDDDSSSRSSSQSSRVSISSNSSAELERRSLSARSKSGTRYSNSPSQSSSCSSAELHRWSKGSDSRSHSFASERGNSTIRIRSRMRTRRETRSRTCSRSRSRARSRSSRRTRTRRRSRSSRTRSISRRIHRSSRSRRSRQRRSYSNRSSRSRTRRSFRSRSGRSRSRSNSRTPGSRFGRSRTRSRSKRSRTISRSHGYSRQTSGSSDYDSPWSRSPSGSRSYERRSRSSSQDSYRKRRSIRSSHSRSYSSD